ncbi:hypothetical protein [Candidatus Contendibacter odensensis]|nr:hypothetical protein [Candidatus Contendobacter odensis]
MEALRLIVEPVNHQLIIDLPPSLGSRRLEVIVFPAIDQGQMPAESVVRRKPSPRLAGTVKLHDDLIAPACLEEDWEALR